MAVLLGLLRVLPTRIGIFPVSRDYIAGMICATHAHRDISVTSNLDSSRIECYPRA